MNYLCRLVSSVLGHHQVTHKTLVSVLRKKLAPQKKGWESDGWLLGEGGGWSPKKERRQLKLRPDSRREEGIPPKGSERPSLFISNSGRGQEFMKKLKERWMRGIVGV